MLSISIWRYECARYVINYVCCDVGSIETIRPTGDDDDDADVAFLFSGFVPGAF